MNRANSGRKGQEPRDFTVKICHIITGETKGTGFVVSLQGQIVTCYHVVRDASETGEVAEGVAVGVYCPKFENREIKVLQARVAACFQDYDDDVVLLQLLENSYFPDGFKTAILGTAEESADHRFRSYGYRILGNQPAALAYGDILGSVEQPLNSRLQADPVMLSSQHIDSGMSGAAVIDMKRDLVVGVIAKAWYSAGDPADRDTSFAVDSLVLTFDPMHLTVEGAMSPETPSPSPPPPKPSMTPGSNINLDNNLDNAPPPLAEWVGRKELLNKLDGDWVDPDILIVGLIGFGGEGKSSITRRWLDELRQNPELPQPKGIFWWAFYERPRVDEFFEAARKFILPETDLQPSSSTSVNVQDILSRLNTGRYLFVLDGIEVLQHQEGDDYGVFTTAKLREFLRAFAAGEHESFCLISSRAPILDLIAFNSYFNRDVERLTLGEGRELLQKLGVNGADTDLDWLVEQWDGYALVLSLLGAYFVKRYQGKIKRIGDILPPTADEPKYDRVRRVLRRYDEHLSQEERQFMRVLSAFRLPIVDTELETIYRRVTTGYEVPRFDQSKPRHLLPAPLRRLWYRLRDWLNRLLGRRPEKPRQRILDPFQAMVERLKRYRILRHNTWKHYYTTHPLIAAHYRERLQDDLDEAREVHCLIKDYYLRRTVDLEKPTLEDLLPLLEAVHHLCQAGYYDEAYDVFWERVLQGDRFVLSKKLNAYDASLAGLREFFPNGDLSQEPQISSPHRKSWIMSHVGLCLKNLGHLAEALPLYQRHNEIKLSREDWHNASTGYRNLAELYAHLGQLAATADAAREALTLARRAENKQGERNSLAYRAWASFLQGYLEKAGALFQEAEALEREINPDERYLYGLNGIQHADCLRRSHDPGYARQVTEANLEICQPNRWLDRISQCHRVLGDLDADAGEHESAREHYRESLKIARGISRRDVLIEALLGRGRWAARQGDLEIAGPDLDEALSYAVAGGYRIYEADIRVGLAWLHLAEGNSSAAREQAERAQRASEDMGYHWGQVDAAEVLAGLRLRSARTVENL